MVYGKQKIINVFKERCHLMQFHFCFHLGLGRISYASEFRVDLKLSANCDR